MKGLKIKREHIRQPIYQAEHAYTSLANAVSLHQREDSEAEDEQWAKSALSGYSALYDSLAVVGRIYIRNPDFLTWKRGEEPRAVAMDWLILQYCVGRPFASALAQTVTSDFPINKRPSKPIADINAKIIEAIEDDQPYENIRFLVDKLAELSSQAGRFSTGIVLLDYIRETCKHPFEGRKSDPEIPKFE